LADVDAVGVEREGEVDVVVDDEGDVEAAEEVAEGEGGFVELAAGFGGGAVLDDGHAAGDGGFDCGEEALAIRGGGVGDVVEGVVGLAVFHAVLFWVEWTE
jgi:hypothetical protein